MRSQSRIGHKISISLMLAGLLFSPLMTVSAFVPLVPISTSTKTYLLQQLTNLQTLLLQSQTIATKTSIAPLVWSSSHAVATTSRNITVDSNPANISHTIKTFNPNKPTEFVTFGFNEMGGGYLWSMKLSMDGYKNSELGIPGYGKGQIGAIRDRMHSNAYNPEQAGTNDYSGRPTNIEVLGNTLTVPQFQMALYNDGSYGGKPTVTLHNNASEFDFSAFSKNVARQYGVPAVETIEYYAYARAPLAIKQFVTGTIANGRLTGQSILAVGNQLEDISSKSGLQKPSATDLSYVVYTNGGVRVDPRFKYLHYRSNNIWQTKILTASALNPDGFECQSAADRGRQTYKIIGTSANLKKTIGLNCVLDTQLMVLSDSPNPALGTGVGLYMPLADSFNSRSLKVVDTATGQVVDDEDRVMQATMFLNDFTPASDLAPQGYYFLGSRHYISGMFAPSPALSLHGKPVIEMLTAKRIVLFGSPEEILLGINKSVTVKPILASSSLAYDIIVSIGQSNAVGRGVGTYTELAQYKNASPLVFQLGRYGVDALKIIPIASEPLQHWGQNPYSKSAATQSFFTEPLRGFVYPLALRYSTLLESPSRKVLIVPAAKGSTSILEWDKKIESQNIYGGAPDSTELYDDVVARVNKVMTDYPGSRVVAIVWQQGEADITGMSNKFIAQKNNMSSTLYQSNLEQLRDNLRRDLTNATCVPFLAGETAQAWKPVNGSALGASTKKEITEAVKAAMASDACMQSRFVSSAGATSNQSKLSSDSAKTLDDSIHYDAAGQFVLAKKYWVQLLELLNQ